MTGPSEEQLAEWQRLADEATPGPWVIEKTSSHMDPETWGIECERWRGYLNMVGFGEDKATAAFIAAAREAVPALLAHVDALEAEASNYSADYDRRGERLWRLAALAGHVPCESDNDATAELVVADALADRAATWNNGWTAASEAAERITETERAEQAALAARLAEVQGELAHWKRVAGHVREQAEQQEARAEQAEAERDDARAAVDPP